MPSMAWVIGAGAVLVAALSLGKQARPVESRPSKAGLVWLKTLAVLRSMVSTLLASFAFSVTLEAVAGASDAVRWTITLAASACLLALIVNALAGLWLLSPFVAADLGLEVVASGLRGTIRGYGWARLEVTTHAGWTAHLPYASIALRPFIVCRQDGARVVELTLRREHWGDEELQCLRQAAVLSPYRDPSSPVSVTRRGRVAAVRLGLAQRSTQERVQRQLERALARVRTPVSAVRRELR